MGDTVEHTTADLGYGTMRLRSRAVHNFICMAPFCRSQMIFVRWQDGISHSEREDKEDKTESTAAAGTAVLLRALCQLAG